MIIQLISKIFGTANNRKIKKLQLIVDKINKLEPSIQALNDAQLTQKTIEFRARLAKGETLDV